ncbi:major royal jelly protein [Rippkaea orientalis PCC 8801]|uniref:Major royal jelly protein n=1 Tax=Rippkaea orientalis (strain PCC 8801 / RF-1) TaxID=41431 RepID=B7K4D5_RIPO1|nr:L-dopachrome tautomerase-related protein [Rippkaea orientalis]ACK67841.1 major royal jelly protein [Rippkaea orientalis PCC 8801]
MLPTSLFKLSTALCTSILIMAGLNPLKAESKPISSAVVAQANTTTKPKVGHLELVANLKITPGNITVSRTGRIFASVHGMRRDSAQLIEIFPGENNWKPFPNAQWNAPPGSSKDVLNTAHGVAIDNQDRLWVIDHGNWMPNGQPVAQPKLLAFDINTGEVVFRLDFDALAAPEGQILQDLAVDEQRGFVYVADCGNTPGILVVDINNRKTWRWEGHPSLQSEDIDLVVEGKKLSFRRPDGSLNPARIAVNPITLSADGEMIFYGAMTGTKWYSVPAKLLREQASTETIAQGVKVVGKKPVSDGVSTDAQGNHYITNLPDNAIDVLNSEGKLTRLVQDDRFLWADNVRFGLDSWLYININQLHRAPIFTGQEKDAGQPPYQIFRVWTGTQGQPGR